MIATPDVGKRHSGRSALPLRNRFLLANRNPVHT
jgi:hypothetical protein